MMITLAQVIGGCRAKSGSASMGHVGVLLDSTYKLAVHLEASCLLKRLAWVGPDFRKT